MTIQTRLNLVVGSLLLIALFAVTIALVIEAGPRAYSENESIMRLTHDVILRSLDGIERTRAPEKDIEALVTRLRSLRHVHIIWQPVSMAPATPSRLLPLERSFEPEQPLVFRILNFRPPPDIVIPVLRGKSAIGHITIAANPSDELAEVLNAVGRILAGGSVLAVALFALTSWVIARALNPLRKLGRAITRLGDGNYDVTIENKGPPEIQSIANRLTSLATALQKSDAENLRLSQQLVTMQDDERRDIARELHDELGPHLFSARAIASTLKTEIDSLSPSPKHASMKSAGLLDQIDAIQKANRRVLQKLAPVGLRELGLKATLAGLSDNWQVQHPAVDVTFHVWDGVDGLDETIGLTVYRTVQEGLTNAFRHARASRIAVCVELIEQPQNLELESDDSIAPATDGSATHGLATHGLATHGDDTILIEVADFGDAPANEPEFGFGLMSMRERITALGGTLQLIPFEAGIRLRATLPFRKKNERSLRS